MFETLRKYLGINVITGAVFVAAVLLLALFLLLWYSRPSQPTPPQATAILYIVPAPTATQPAIEPSPVPSDTPASEIYPTPIPGENIMLGSYVQVSGTEGEGLRVRSEAGLDGSVRFLAMEAEVFLVKDGPQEVDGYTWWYLVAPYDDKRSGWAVSNYLSVAQNP